MREVNIHLRWVLEEYPFFLNSTRYIGYGGTPKLAVSEITGPSLLKAIKCLVSPIKSNRRLSTKSKVEISGTGEVGMYRFFMLTIICCVDESHRGEPRNGQQGSRA
jgi:hypothetical protein